MNLPDEKREALAEGICSAICEGTAPAGIPGAENPRHRIAACYEHQRAADALAPLLAGWLAEARGEALRNLVSDWQANGNSRPLGDPTAATWHEAARQLLDVLTDSEGEG